MVSLSDIIKGIPASATLAASQKANELKAQGRDVISFTVGEPDFDTPPHVKAAAVEALEKGLTKYTATNGILPLREEICKKLKRDQGVDYKPSEVIVTNGGKQALAAAFAVLLNPGDEVVIPAPYWTSYPDMVKLVGGVPVIVETSAANGYLATPESIVNACTPMTRAIVINTPSNPTGGAYSGAELRAIALALSKLPYRDQLVVISDEVYEYITFDGFKHESFLTAAPEWRANTVLVNAYSKAYSMTGWRVGYAVGPKFIIDAMNTHQSQFTSNVCSIAQYAAVKAYEDGYAFPRMMQTEFQKRLDLVVAAVAEMPGIKISVKPRGAFYAFLELDGLLGKKSGSTTINSGEDFAAYLLDQFDVVTVQGEAFGAAAAVRISFALHPDLLKKGLDRIKQAAERLQ